MTAAIRRTMAEDPSEFDPRKYMKPAMAMMEEVCKARFDAFGTSGHADRIRPLSLDAMARRYQG
jgi:fructose-bisphosphate aldolase, class II